MRRVLSFLELVSKDKIPEGINTLPLGHPCLFELAREQMIFRRDPDKLITHLCMFCMHYSFQTWGF